jgi:hypothetical protein
VSPAANERARKFRECAATEQVRGLSAEPALHGGQKPRSSAARRRSGTRAPADEHPDPRNAGPSDPSFAPGDTVLTNNPHAGSPRRLLGNHRRLHSSQGLTQDVCFAPTATTRNPSWRSLLRALRLLKPCKHRSLRADRRAKAADGALAGPSPAERSRLGQRRWLLSARTSRLLTAHLVAAVAALQRCRRPSREGRFPGLRLPPIGWQLAISATWVPRKTALPDAASSCPIPPTEAGLSSRLGRARRSARRCRPANIIARPTGTSVCRYRRGHYVLCA